MLKKVLPLALTAALAGCAAVQTAQSLVSTGLQTFLVRSLTVNTPEGEKVTNILIWADTGHTTSPTIKEIAKGVANGGEPATISIDTSTVTYSDTDVTSDSTYTYTAKFMNDQTLSRTMHPYSTADAGTVEATSPILSLGAPPVTGSTPTFAWSLTPGSTPTGYMVVVGKIGSGDLTHVDQNSAFTGEPVYSAFLDASKHATGVTFGTASDLSLLSDEMAKVLPARFAKKDKDVAPLEAGTYMWLVSPLKIDESATKFAIGTQAFGVFAVQ